MPMHNKVVCFVATGGETIFETLAGNELEEGETSIFKDGYMEDRYDLDGLLRYLSYSGSPSSRTFW